MVRSSMVLALFLGMAPFYSIVGAADLIWDGGGGGNWEDPTWNGGMTPEQILGRSNGATGTGHHIIIADGDVLYNGNEFGDFRVLQGNDMTIGVGGSWNQITETTWSENRWTEMDLSNLNLSGGSFRRIGAGIPTEPSGGALIFGSWRGDDNFGEIDPPQVINVVIEEGGSLENEGQLWFGAGEDHDAGLTVNMTINEGTVDLTGGDIQIEDGLSGDWVMFYGFDDSTSMPKNEQYTVNFIGPGSITVDSAGIVAPVRPDAGSEFTNLDSIGYEDLWGLGILQANGESGEDGADFNEFFRIEGDQGADNYTLVSLIGVDVGIDGDINMDGRVDATDLNIIGLNWQMDGKTAEEGDLTGDGVVNAADLNILGLNWQAGAAAPAAVPEPGASFLISLAVLGWFGAFRRKR